MAQRIKQTIKSLFGLLLAVVLVAACTDEEDGGGNQSDTSGGSQDTSGGSVDTSGGSVDTSGGSEDTSGGSVDTSGASQDTSGGAVDTSGASEDTSGGAVDTSGVSQDTSGASQDTSGGGDTSGGSNADEAWAYLDTCFADAQAVNVLTITDLANEAEGVFVRIGIDPEDRFGTSGTTPYDLLYFGIVTPDEEACITDRDLLDYIGSHHNFDDNATAQVVDSTYNLHMTLAYTDPVTRTDTLTRTDAGGNTTLGPIELAEIACRGIPEGAGCIHRLSATNP